MKVPSVERERQAAATFPPSLFLSKHELLLVVFINTGGVGVVRGQTHDKLLQAQRLLWPKGTRELKPHDR